MSIATWKKEYCPRSVKYYKGRKDATILKRDIRKWKGLIFANLNKHELKRGNANINDKEGNRFCIRSGTCALCCNYIKFESCQGCPLARVRNGLRCDERGGKQKNSPYSSFTTLGKPQSMVKWLEKALEMVTKKS